MARRKPPFSFDLNGIVAFASFSGCGHSLVSSIIDGHKNAIISREQKVLLRLYTGRIDPPQAWSAIYNASLHYTKRGRWHKGSETSHIIPGHYNGTAKDVVNILGDKHGLGFIRNVSECPDFIQKIKSITNLPLHILHIYRNPFDVIAHSYKFMPERNLDGVVKLVVRRFKLANYAVQVAKNWSNVLDVKLEDLSGIQISNILQFLGLEDYEDFIQSADSIIVRSLMDESGVVEWSEENVGIVNNLCSAIPYLGGYRR
jgi:hypothetical protein